MNYRLYHMLRAVDNQIGGLICFILSLFYRMKHDVTIGEKPKIVIMKFWGMGSILLSSPAVRNIKEYYQPSELIILTLDQNRELCGSLGLFTEILSCKLRPFPLFVWQLIKNIIYLRSKNIDILFDFEFFTRFSAILTALSGAKKNIGFYAREVSRGNFYHHYAPFNGYWHIKDIYLNLVKKVIPNVKEYPMLVPQSDDKILDAIGLKGKKYVAINPNSEPIAIQRRWPKEYFVELINYIAGQKIPVILLGSRHEASYIAEIISSTVSPDIVINLGGKTNIKELTAVLRDAALFITNDSGPLHLASALNTPTISFFGPETPIIYGPTNSNNTIFFKNMDCSPCINVHRAKEMHCVRGKADCLLQINPKEVISAIERILQI